MKNQPSLSSYSYNSFLTHDSEQHAEALGEWDQVYDQLSAGSFEGKLVDIWFEGLQLFRETTNRAVSQRGTSWQGCYVFAIPVAMKGPGLFSKQLLTRDSMIVFHSNQEFSLTAPEGFDVVALAIPEKKLIDALQPGSAEELGKLFPKGPAVMLAGSGQLDDLRNCLLSIFDPASFEPEHLAYPQVQKAMSSAIIGHLTEILCSATQAPMPTRSFKAHSYIVKDAVDYAMIHAADPITVADLCLHLNVSRRMLNYCFQDVLATNPVQYLRSLRLNGVRRDLRQSRVIPGTIRDIACNWGFWHLPRFASEYRQLFGELPSETAQLSRNSRSFITVPSWRDTHLAS